MENMKLIRTGSDVIQILIDYLAKDALGSDFLRTYMTGGNKASENIRSQHEALDKLVQSSSRIEDETKAIAEKALQNNERLSGIYESIEGLRESVESIEAEYQLYMKQFKQLIEQAREITGMVNSITEIAAQTNLLSFNASIEAARAGEAGKGFRIIANEVKKLSDDTSKTSETIKNKVEQLANSITSLEKGTQKNAGDLTKLAGETDATLERFNNVRKVNSENNENVTNISSHIKDNINNIEGMISAVKNTEAENEKTLDDFARCASENQMLFNDLYSFAYQIKAIFSDLSK